MGIFELKDRVFVALLVHSQRNGFTSYDLEEVAKLYGINLAPGQSTLLARELKNNMSKKMFTRELQS